MYNTLYIHTYTGNKLAKKIIKITIHSIKNIDRFICICKQNVSEL